MCFKYSALLLLFASLAGCRHSAKQQVADAGLKLIPIPEQRILAINNATQQAPYQGSTGIIEGTVTMVGDAAPDMTTYIDKIPADCSIAMNTYGKLFREGPGRVIADVLVAVTGYKGYLKPKGDHIELLARDCAWTKKTVGVTFGQHIEVKSADTRPYIPQLLGGPPGALLVAVPGGDAVPVFPQEPGHYVLIDSMRLYSKADVFVVRYPTFDVTGHDGHYRIEGIPVGSVTVSALLPSTSSTDARTVNVSANQAVNVDLVLKFSRAAMQPQPAPSTTAPAAPSH